MLTRSDINTFKGIGHFIISTIMMTIENPNIFIVIASICFSVAGLAYFITISYKRP